MNRTVQYLSEVNRLLANLNEAGGSVELQLEGIRPVARVASLDPLVLERYGGRKNKLPLLAGSVAVEAMMWQEIDRDRVNPLVAVRAGEYAVFAVWVRPDIVDWIAQEVLTGGVEQP